MLSKCDTYNPDCQAIVTNDTTRQSQTGTGPVGDILELVVITK